MPMWDRNYSTRTLIADYLSSFLNNRSRLSYFYFFYLSFWTKCFSLFRHFTVKSLEWLDHLIRDGKRTWRRTKGCEARPLGETDNTSSQVLKPILSSFVYSVGLAYNDLYYNDVRVQLETWLPHVDSVSIEMFAKRKENRDCCPVSPSTLMHLVFQDLKGSDKNRINHL